MIEGFGFRGQRLGHRLQVFFGYGSSVGDFDPRSRVRGSEFRVKDLGYMF
jgi:hypothetical protein